MPPTGPTQIRLARLCYLGGADGLGQVLVAQRFDADFNYLG